MRLFLKKLLLYASIFWLLNMLVGYHLSTFETEDLHSNRQYFPTLRWADYYNLQDPIDVLILGSSHAYRTYDPKVMGLEMNEDGGVFNFGSSAQSPVTSYFVLKEVTQKHKPKLVVFDLYFMVFTADEQLKNGRYNWQQMQKSKVKRQFFWQGFTLSDQLSLTLFPSYVYKTYLKSKIYKFLGRQYLPPLKGNYQGNGFVSTSDTLGIERLKNKNQFDVFEFDTTAITSRNIAYLKKIQEYCSSENIPLVFVAAPMPAITVEKIETYNQFYQLFNRLSEQWEVSYIDYNITRIPSLQDHTHYYDDDHLNAAGAQIFSRALSKNLKQLR